jgi:hypothetical protein
VGAAFELLPIGSLSTTVHGLPVADGSSSAGTNTGIVAVDVKALYAIHPLIAVGIAPRYVFNIAAGGSASTTMFDPRVVGVIHKDVAPKLGVFGVLGLGYATIASVESDFPNTSGVTLSLGAGASYQLLPKLLGTLSVEYEFGFESGSANYDFSFNQLFISLGVLAGIL